MRLREAVLGFAVVASAAMPAAAQGLDVGAAGAVRIERVAIDARVEEGVARVEVDETFGNTTGSVLEGVYRFKLPEDAVIGSFSMWMAGKEKRGVVLDAAQARATYDSIVRKLRDPGLLEQIGWREFRVSVYPIPAHDTVRVKLVYAHLVRDDLGLQTLEIPLPERCGSVGDLRVKASFRAKRSLAGIDCPSHADAELESDDGGARARWSGDGVEPRGPFVVRAIPRRDGFDVTLLADRAVGAEYGWFVARIVPRLAAPPRIARDVVFVIDRSGSMKGPKIEQARAALLAGLDTLAPGDRFDVISFASDVTPAEGRLHDAAPDELERAQAAARDLSATGGTNLHDALAAAVARFDATPGRFRAIVFLTDGSPTVGTTDPDRILNTWRKRCGDVRLFAFGVGEDVKDFLLTKLAVAGRGDARYVREGENLEVPLAALFDRVKTPLLLDPDLGVDGAGVRVLDREPRRLPDLFQGRPLLVSGRFAGAGPAMIRLRGSSGSNDVVVDVPVEFPVSTPLRPHVAQIWAKARIEGLLDDMRALGANAEIREEIRTLGLEHHLVTPYTSFLVVEEGVKLADARGDGPPRRAVPVEEGTSANGTPPPLGGGGDTTPAGNPGGASSPDPLISAVDGFDVARMRAPEAGGNTAGMRPTTGGLGGRRGGGEGFERWEFWWENNKDAFLQGAARDRAQDDGGSMRAALASRLVPVFLEELNETDADIADSAALALGRSISAKDSAEAIEPLTRALRHPAPTVRQSATLALGVVGSKDALLSLRELLNDTPEGRRLTNQPQGVEELVRSLAAASLGLIGDPESVDDLRKVITAANPACAPGTRAMAILALGLMKEGQADLVRFLAGLMDDRSLPRLVRAQVPIAIGRLGRRSEGGAVAARQVLGSEIVPRFEDDKIDDDLRRSLAICVGVLATVEDADAIDALVKYAIRGSDAQTRHFSIMALAEIGARDGEPAKHAAIHGMLRDFFESELLHPRRITQQPYGALGLAVYSRNEQFGVEARTRAVAKLSEAIDGTSNPSYQASMTIGLGLLRAKSCAGDLWMRYGATNDGPLKGAIALALGMMESGDHAEPLLKQLGSKNLEPRLRLQLARALGSMADPRAVPVLIDCLQSSETLAGSASAAQALGVLGDERAVAPLLAIVKDPTKHPLARGFAVAALGMVADEARTPWNAVFAIDGNYRAKVAALAEILDLL